MSNKDLAEHILAELIHRGVGQFVVCPGSRNAPLTHLLAASSYDPIYGFEERSAGFFALGLARRTRSPVAIITTSGTAVGELLPAMMEAYYTSTPIIAVTADRPRRYRGTNAPQTAEQLGIFTLYSPFMYDVEGGERLSLSEWDMKTPLHLNVCFEEPAPQEEVVFLPEVTLGDREEKLSSLSSLEKVSGFLEKVSSPLVLVGAVAEEARQVVLDFLLKLKAPVYPEAISGLRENPLLDKIRLIEPKLTLHDAVVRIGGVPTHRCWRDLESGVLPVMSITPYPFSGTPNGEVVCESLEPFFKAFSSYYDFGKAFFSPPSQEELLVSLENLFDEEPESEAALVHEISKRYPEEARIFLGNSLPIREWDLAASYKHPHADVWATRGLNGIDGQLSVFLGLADPLKLNLALVGDLTALYDLAAPWFSAASAPKKAIAIINNRGGQIFARKYNQPYMTSPHQLNFEPFAKMWNMPYTQWVSREGSLSWEGIIEVCPNPVASRRFWEKWEACLSRFFLSQVALCR